MRQDEIRNTPIDKQAAMNNFPNTDLNMLAVQSKDAQAEKAACAISETSSASATHGTTLMGTFATTSNVENVTTAPLEASSKSTVSSKILKEGGFESEAEKGEAKHESAPGGSGGALFGKKPCGSLGAAQTMTKCLSCEYRSNQGTKMVEHGMTFPVCVWYG